MTALPRGLRREWSGAPTAEPLTDAALLAAVALGDDEACRRLVSRHAPRVLGVARAICRDDGVAEDVTQRTFEQAWRHAAAFDPARAAASTWLLVIARRLAIDEVRRRRPTPVAHDRLEALVGAATTDCEQAGLAGEQRARLVGALSQLPEGQRRAVVMASLAGLTAAEVAAVEAIPLGTAKTRIRLGLRRLRALLQTEDGRG